MNLLTARNLGKAFRSYRQEWMRVASWMGLPVKPDEENWVVRNITLDLAPGESVGIVGQNGAGKSTLLKLITGTLTPTEGSVSMHGRVSALLELGMGFNTELTGRQNVYHAGGLMGHSVSAIDAAIDEIEDFAEVGDYFDAPVRTYSSGMQMRVAFAIATAYRPDLLIVDEALSVGDVYFQHKSFERIRQFKREGTSLLFVSHDQGPVQALCDRAILLNHGVLLKDGRPEDVMNFYNALIAERENRTIRQVRSKNGTLETASGTGEVVFEVIQLLDQQERPVDVLAVGQEAYLSLSLIAHTSISDLVVGFLIKDRLGQPIFGTNTHYLKKQPVSLAPGQRIALRFVFPANLGPSTYSISVAAHASETHVTRNYEWRDLAVTFEITNLDKAEFVGSNWLPVSTELQIL